MGERDIRPNIFSNFTQAHESVAMGIEKNPAILSDPDIKEAAISTGLVAYDAFLKSAGIPRDDAQTKLDEARNQLKTKPNMIVDFVTRYSGYVLKFRDTKKSPIIAHTSGTDEEAFFNLDPETLPPVSIKTKSTTFKPNLEDLLSRKP